MVGPRRSCRRPDRPAARRRPRRDASGGFTLKMGSYSSSRSQVSEQVVRCHLGGDVDAALLAPADPLDRARRRTLITYNLEPMCSASTSRAMIDSSATAGQPGQPEPSGTSPSCAQALWSASRGSCACCATAAPNGLTYSAQRHQRHRRGSHLPSSRKPYRTARSSHVADLGGLFAGQALRHRPDRAGTSSDLPRGRTRATCSTISALSATGSVFAIACTAVKRQRRSGSRASGDGLGVLASRFAQVGVQVDEPRQQQTVGISTRSPDRLAGAPAITPSSISTSVRLPPSGRLPLVPQADHQSPLPPASSR